MELSGVGLWSSQLLRRPRRGRRRGRLFDAIIAWGDEEAILCRVDEHRAAGAGHVCVQVLGADPRTFPGEQWRRLAAALG